MPRSAAAARRITPSLIISLLALVIATSGTAYAIGKGEVTSRHLARDAVTAAKIKNGAVIAPKIRAGAVRGPAIKNGSVGAGKLGAGAVTEAKIAPDAVTGQSVANGSLRLDDLGGETTDQQSLVPAAVSIPANECRSIFLTLFNPAPNGVVGSLVVGTITTPGGGAVLDNNGYAVPTLVTQTSQGGAIPQFRVCAAGSAQNVPAGSVVQWSLLGP